MKILKLIAGFVAVAGAVVAISGPTAGALAPANKCDVTKLPYGVGGAGEKMKVEGTKITATFTVTGTNCTTPVTLATWKTVNGPEAKGAPIEQQVFFGHTTQSFGPGTHTITTTLPDCYWQADLLLGSNPKAPDGTAHYAYQNGKILTDSPLRDFKFGGDKTCVVPEDPKTPETPEQPKGRGGDTPQVKAVTTLPETGAGAVAGTFVGVSASAGIAHAIVSRIRRILRK